jgi:hypothetical protein
MKLLADKQVTTDGGSISRTSPFSHPGQPGIALGDAHSPIDVTDSAS